jgi:hypothetical protein
VDITIAPNGFLVALTSDKRIFCSIGNQLWKEIPPVVNSANAKPINVSLGLASMLYVMLDNGTIYRLGDSTSKTIWKPIPGVDGGAKYISCGVDNNLWAISNGSKILKMDGSATTLTWTDVTSSMPPNVTIAAISTATRDLVWALDSTGKVWRQNVSSTATLVLSPVTNSLDD